MSQKALIISGDDLGLSREVNAGILRAHRDGVLGAASLMVAGEARDEALVAARQSPSLDLGTHIVLCRGKSVLVPEELKGLVDGGGDFGENPVLNGIRYFFNRRLRESLRRECRAQIELQIKLGAPPTHLDGHLNFQVHPAVADILADLALEYRIPYLRLPREPLWVTLKLAPDHAARKTVESIIFRALSARAGRVMRERGLKAVDRLFGLHQSGNLTESYLLGLIRRLKPGVTEIYFHPACGLGSNQVEAARLREVEILTNPRVIEALKAEGVRLTTFAALSREGA
jgi:chitin disaccharide deacetylase